MKSRSYEKAILFGLLAVAVMVAGCSHPRATPTTSAPPPPPPPMPQPTVTLQASPAMIQKGESVTLTWSSTNATQLDLQPAVGQVAPEGSVRVTPDASTTYTITATGPGGNAQASARITVAEPPPPPPAVTESLEDLFRKNVRDAFFDYDRSDIRPDARVALAQTAEFLRTNPSVRVTLEGHCDERGSTEYNIALGDRRAQAARQYLASLGVSADRMEAISFGKEKPFCTESNETCWQQNRRAHFVMAR